MLNNALLYITTIYKGLKKLTFKRINNPVNKWVKDLNRQFSKEVSSTNNQQTHEETFNIPGHQGNANQNDTEISSPSSQNGYCEENKCW
jgi:hypothetical protein